MTANQNIYLIGMMGSWKSTIGHRLAKRLKLKFVDLDEEIEKSTGFSIAHLFEVYGEGEFREIETKQLELVARDKQQVIATGGGAVIAERNRRIFRETGFTILLRARPEILAGRIKYSEKRPLLRKSNKVLANLQEIWVKRKSNYETTAHDCIDTDSLNPSEVLEQTVELLKSARMI